MRTENQRRSDRVNIKVPVRVLAVDATGQKFIAQGHTLTISRHGATVALDRKLTSGLNLTICPGTSKRESSAIVMGQIGGQSGVYIYGIAVLEPNINLWGIQFPPLAESEEGLVKLLLECSSCKTREVVYLNELETDVFEGNNRLPRSCSQCAEWTPWLQTLNDLPAGNSGVQSETVPESSLAPVNRAQNNRKHVRVQVKMKACIHHPGFEEEIVDVKDVSRGGFSFVSSKGYIEGSRIEVAVPYSGGESKHLCRRADQQNSGAVRQRANKVRCVLYPIPLSVVRKQRFAFLPFCLKPPISTKLDKTILKAPRAV